MQRANLKGQIRVEIEIDGRLVRIVVLANMRCRCVDDGSGGGLVLEVLLCNSVLN
jgi:hypothetical protein